MVNGAICYEFPQPVMNHFCWRVRACYELNGNVMNYATPGKRRSFEHIGENGGGSGAGGLGDASAPASAATKAPALASRIT